MGATIFGIELGANGPITPTDSGEGYDTVQPIDLKFRVGTMLGDAHVYLSAGMSRAAYDFYYESYDATGMNYGIGIEYNLMDNAFIGADLSKRVFNGGDYWKLEDTGLTSASLRVGFRF